MTENRNWAYGVTLPGLGTIWYGRAYFDREGIVDPVTTAPYAKEEIAAIVNGAAEDAEGYTFDLPAGAVLGMNGFWYDAAGAAAITGHADPLAQSAEGVFTAADGTVVAGPIA